MKKKLSSKESPVSARHETAEASQSNAKPVFPRWATQDDVARRLPGHTTNSKSSRANLLPLKLVDSGKKSTAKKDRFDKSAGRPRLTVSPTAKVTPSRQPPSLHTPSKSKDLGPGNASSYKGQGSRESSSKVNRTRDNGLYTTVQRPLTERGPPSARSNKSGKLSSLQRSLERVSRELKASVGKKDKEVKTPAKIQVTETTQDFSSSHRTNESIMTRISKAGIDATMKKRLEKYRVLPLAERVQFQNELISALAGILKDERTRRMSCEQQFEAILLKDSKKIDELVGWLDSGSQSRVLAEIKRLIIPYN